jgi:hypothetical protein
LDAATEPALSAHADALDTRRGCTSTDFSTSTFVFLRVNKAITDTEPFRLSPVDLTGKNRVHVVVGNRGPVNYALPFNAPASGMMPHRRLNQLTPALATPRVLALTRTPPPVLGVAQLKLSPED